MIEVEESTIEDQDRVAINLRIHFIGCHLGALAVGGLAAWYVKPWIAFALALLFGALLYFSGVFVIWWWCDRREARKNKGRTA